jgi:hypothetical protein
MPRARRPACGAIRPAVTDRGVGLRRRVPLNWRRRRQVAAPSPEISMAKGQIRSNKEKKKPKQDKTKKTAAASPFAGIQVKSNPPTEKK